MQGFLDASGLLQQELEKSQAERDQLRAEKTGLARGEKVQNNLKEFNVYRHNAQEEIG